MRPLKLAIMDVGNLAKLQARAFAAVPEVEVATVRRHTPAWTRSIQACAGSGPGHCRGTGGAGG